MLFSLLINGLLLITSLTLTHTHTHIDSLHFPTPLLHFQLHPQYPLPGGVSIPSLTTPITQSTDEATNEETTFLTVIREKPQGTVEMLIQECPPSLLKGFMKLFPSLESKGLTVITLCQRTMNDMTSWSAEVESERDSLLEHVRICVTGVVFFDNTKYMYRIYLIKRPGVYFISKSVKGAFKRGGRLFKEGVY